MGDLSTVKFENGLCGRRLVCTLYCGFPEFSTQFNLIQCLHYQNIEIHFPPVEFTNLQKIYTLNTKFTETHQVHEKQWVCQFTVSYLFKN